MLDNIEKQINEFGIKKGDKLVVHCAFSKMKSNISPQDFCHLLMDIIGGNGVLMMPSFTYCNVRELRDPGYFCFNVNSTPGKTGILSEVFRKMPDVYRSWNPSHSMLAWGKNAESYVQNHHKVESLGIGSPLELMERKNGKVLLIACDHANTFFHVVEAACNGPCLDIPPETHDAILPSGEKTTLQTFAWRHANCPVTDGKIYLKEMEKLKLLNKGKIGSADCICMKMKECRTVLTRLLKSPVGCANCGVRPYK